MKSFEFSTNWNNKLQCNSFTTLRLKGTYFIDEEVEIYLKKEKLPGRYVIRQKKELKLEQINDFISYLDTGYNAGCCKEILRTMYKALDINWATQPLYLYLVIKIKEKQPEQTELL